MKRIGRIRLLKMIITIPFLVIILVCACCYYRLTNGTRNRKLEIKDLNATTILLLTTIWLSIQLILLNQKINI